MHNKEYKPAFVLAHRNFKVWWPRTGLLVVIINLRILFMFINTFNINVGTNSIAIVDN